MKLFGKKTEDIVPERKNVWSIVIQVLIAALTALSGVFGVSPKTRLQFY